MTSKITIGIQIGDSTHIQLQAIISVNFSTIKTIVRSPLKPMPLLVDTCLFESLLIFSPTPSHRSFQRYQACKDKTPHSHL